MGDGVARVSVHHLVDPLVENRSAHTVSALLAVAHDRDLASLGIAVGQPHVSLAGLCETAKIA